MFEFAVDSRPWLFPLPCWSNAGTSSNGVPNDHAQPGGGHFSRRFDG